MGLVTSKKDNWYLHDTYIENIFISEYMVNAPGDYVKVYIYSLMHAQLSIDMSVRQIADDLGIDEETAEKAFEYWEKAGVIRAFGNDIEFLSVKGESSDVPHKEEQMGPLGDDELKWLISQIELISAHPMSGTEVKAVEEWITDLNADPEVILCAYSHCAKAGKTSYRYVGKVLNNWIKEGLSNADEVNAFLEKEDERKQIYRRIFKALGFNRNWTENEEEMMDRWIDIYHFSLDRILEACGKTSGISSPNINYVNKVLENWHEESRKSDGTSAEGVGKKISMKNVLAYYEHIRENAESEAEARRQEVFMRVPALKDIEDRLRNAGIGLSKSMFRGGEGAREKLKNEIESLKAERAFLLTENNFSADYMDVKYKCDKCLDTGIDDESGQRCECFSRRMGEAAQWLKHRK